MTRANDSRMEAAGCRRLHGFSESGHERSRKDARGEGRREEPLLLVWAAAHVRQVETAAGVPPGRSIDDLDRAELSRNIEAVGPGHRDRPADELDHRKRRSEEHTSELQSLRHLVCRLLLEKKKKKQ